MKCRRRRFVSRNEKEKALCNNFDFGQCYTFAFNNIVCYLFVDIRFVAANVAIVIGFIENIE